MKKEILNCPIHNPNTTITIGTVPIETQTIMAESNTITLKCSCDQREPKTENYCDSRTPEERQNEPKSETAVSETKPERIKWSKEFDEKFCYKDKPDWLNQMGAANIKSFIRALLATEREKARREIIKEFLEGKRCLTCGDKKSEGLSDTCADCMKNA